MTESSQSARASETTRTETTRTTITRWVDGKDGLMPWAPGKAAAIAGATAALIIGGGSLYGVNRIQNDLTDETRRDLVANNISIENLEIDFEHRDGIIRGVLPAGVTVDQVRDLIDAEGIRVLDLSGLQEVAPVPAPEPEPAPAPPVTEAEAPPSTEAEPVVATGPTEVSVAVVADAITLRGEVLSEAQRTILVDAATERFGADNVTDELTVSGVDEATPGADDRVGSLAALIAAIGPGVVGDGELTDTSLKFDGTVPDEAAAAAIDDVVGAAAGVESSQTNIAVAAPEPDPADSTPEEPAAVPEECRPNSTRLRVRSEKPSCSRRTLPSSHPLRKRPSTKLLPLSKGTNCRSCRSRDTPMIGVLLATTRR
jgi:hypothetical protein